MAVRSTTQVKGKCNFCQAEFDKGKMTTHLKHCKMRAAAIAQEPGSPEKETRLFHLIVEGQYNPQYWMHLEVDSSASLFDLDGFLRGIWLECCDHLSAFTINGTNYEIEPSMVDPFMAFEEEEEEEDEEDEEEDDLVGPDGVVNIDALLEMSTASAFIMGLPSAWREELKQLRTVDNLVALAKTELKSLRKGSYPRTPEEQEAYTLRRMREHLLRDILDMLEDRSMDVLLEKVLSVGTKFTHEYDFGSTTHLKLKVVGERQGVSQPENEPIGILARNMPPEILCVRCGQRATQVLGGYYDIEENAFCDVCAHEEDEEMLLPIVNSPRVGVCGYTGEDEEEEDEEEEESEDV